MSYREWININVHSHTELHSEICHYAVHILLGNLVCTQLAQLFQLKLYPYQFFWPSSSNAGVIILFGSRYCNRVKWSIKMKSSVGFIRMLNSDLLRSFLFIKWLAINILELVIVYTKQPWVNSKHSSLTTFSNTRTKLLLSLSMPCLIQPCHSTLF